MHILDSHETMPQIVAVTAQNINVILSTMKTYGRYLYLYFCNSILLIILSQLYITTTSAVSTMSGHISGYGPSIILIESNIGLFIAICLVALRAYSARKVNGRWRWDFIWISLAMIFLCLDCAFINYAVYLGLGKHLVDVPFSQLSIVIHWLYIVVLISFPGQAMAKFSVVSLLLQIQGPQAKKRRIALLVLSVLLALIGLTAIFVILFQCKPISKLWNIFEAGKCTYSPQVFDFLVFQGGKSVINFHIICSVTIVD